jgi:hypothetical protein
MAPDAGAPPISTARAYTEVLVVFGLVFAAGIISAAESLGGTNLAPSGGWSTFGPGAVDVVCNAAIIVIAVVLLSARRGVTGQLLGIRAPQPLPGMGRASRATRMAAVGLLAFLAGGIATSHLAGGHHYPEPAHLSLAYVVYQLGDSLFNGVVEEMVALAFVVSTLRQARRPAAEIVVVAVLLRCSYHIYYGAGIVGIVIWSSVFALLYLRFRSVVPLIILHFLWDSFQVLSLKSSAFAALGALLGLGLLITAVVMWIVAEASHRSAIRPAGFAPYPGAPYPAPPYWGAPYQGAPYPGAPYPGAPYPGAPYPGAPYPGAPYPGAPYPGAPYPGAPYPGVPFPGVPYPGATSPEAAGQPPQAGQYPPASPPPHGQAAPPGDAGPPAPPW